MNFEEYWEAFLVELREKHEQNKKLDESLYYKELTKTESKTYNDGSIETVQDMRDTILRQASCTEFNRGYITTETKVDTDVDGWSDNDGGIEVESVYVSLETIGIRPFTDEEFEELLIRGITLRRLFKEYIKGKIVENNSEEISKCRQWRMEVDCKILELFKDDIITFDQVVKATLSSCSV